MTSNVADAPPTYVIRTVYDDTHRSKSYLQPSIMSMANRPTLIGTLENHSPQTDGSFSICIAGGEGVFISKNLLESIPAEHRPALDTTLAGQSIETFTSGTMTSIGTTFFPVILTNANTRERIRIVLYTLVVPSLFMGMFIGRGGLGFDFTESWGQGGVMYEFDFDQAGTHRVRGV